LLTLTIVKIVLVLMFNTRRPTSKL